MADLAPHAERTEQRQLAGMAEILTFVTNLSSPPGQNSATQKRKRSIDIGLATVLAAIILAAGGVIGAAITHFFAPDTNHFASVTPTVTVTKIVKGHAVRSSINITDTPDTKLDIDNMV